MKLRSYELMTAKDLCLVGDLRKLNSPEAVSFLLDMLYMSMSLTRDTEGAFRTLENYVLRTHDKIQRCPCCGNVRPLLWHHWYSRWDAAWKRERARDADAIRKVTHKKMVCGSCNGRLKRENFECSLDGAKLLPKLPDVFIPKDVKSHILPSWEVQCAALGNGVAIPGYPNTYKHDDLDWRGRHSLKRQAEFDLRRECFAAAYTGAVLSDVLAPRDFSRKHDSCKKMFKKLELVGLLPEMCKEESSDG